MCGPMLRPGADDKEQILVDKDGNEFRIRFRDAETCRRSYEEFSEIFRASRRKIAEENNQREKKQKQT